MSSATEHPDYPFGAVNLKTGAYYERVIINAAGTIKAAGSIGSYYTVVRDTKQIVPAPKRIFPVANPLAFKEMFFALRKQHQYSDPIAHLAKWWKFTRMK